MGELSDRKYQQFNLFLGNLIQHDLQKNDDYWVTPGAQDIIGSSQVAAILYALTALKVMNALPLPGEGWVVTVE